MLKTCTGPCGRKLELNDVNFRKDRKEKSGYRSRCKDCLRGKYQFAKKWPSVDALDRNWASTPVTKPPVAKFATDQETQTPVETLPSGHFVRGVSSLVRKDGTLIAQWIKTAVEHEDEYTQLLEACERLADKWPEKAVPVKAPKVTDEDLLAAVVLGDPHIGMFSWAQETGQDFDLEIAESNLYTAVDHLVGLAPKAKEGLLISLGDFFHADNSANQTTRGTRVDVDSRWAKVLSVGIRLIRRCIDRMLEKHEKVTFVSVAGNHDSHTALMLALAIAQFYEDEPRVHVDTSPGKFHWYRFGKTLIGATHGDTVKHKDLPGVMACDRKEDWGETDYRYFYCGHIHHDTVREYPGVIVESLRTLAPADAWHKGQGYRSGQDLKMDIIHKKWGRVNRHIVGINQVWDLKDAK